MKAKSKSIFREILDSTDHQLIDRLHKEFRGLDIELSPRFNRAVIDFGQMRFNFRAYRRFQSKRQLEIDLDARINLIRNVCSQVRRDEGYFENPLSDEFIGRHIFMALVEKAVLIAENLNKNNPRDTLAFSFHLWNFRRELASLDVSKPAETITAILEKTNALDGVGKQWRVATVKNKISSVQKLVDASKEAGACHEPRIIGDHPKTESLVFLKSISGGCDNCLRAWQKVIKIKTSKESPFKAAGKELSKEFPEVAGSISEFVKQLEDMPLMEILSRTPSQLRG